MSHVRMLNPRLIRCYFFMNLLLICWESQHLVDGHSSGRQVGGCQNTDAMFAYLCVYYIRIYIYIYIIIYIIYMFAVSTARLDSQQEFEEFCYLCFHHMFGATTAFTSLSRSPTLPPYPNPPTWDVIVTTSTVVTHSSKAEKPLSC